MMLPFQGKKPIVHPTAYVSEAACLIGEVEVGEGANIWPGVIIRADHGRIRIGRNANIQDNTVVHSNGPMEIGEFVVFGHSTVVEAERVGDYALVGNNATVLPGVVVGDYSIVAANSVVLEGTNIPPRSFVVGVPGTVKGQVTEEQIKMVRLTAESYAHLAQEYKKEQEGLSK